MSKIYTTEITSDQIASDNPLHQRLLKPYLEAGRWVKGDLLEVGCGEGRGIEHLLPHTSSYTAIDKIGTAITQLSKKYPGSRFIQGHLPPLPFEDASFDSVTSFQVIEHIRDDHYFLKEIQRVLRPGGIALITTPNRPMSLSRNPWHVREYSATELAAIAGRIFNSVEMKGIAGNDRVMVYHEKNRAAVRRLMRWDVLDLQHKLPAALLRIPYEILNRMNRDKLRTTDDALVASIKAADYFVTDAAAGALDLFLIAVK